MNVNHSYYPLPYGQLLLHPKYRVFHRLFKSLWHSVTLIIYEKETEGVRKKEMARREVRELTSEQLAFVVSGAEEDASQEQKNNNRWYNEIA